MRRREFRIRLGDVYFSEREERYDAEIKEAKSQSGKARQGLLRSDEVIE